MRWRLEGADLVQAQLRRLSAESRSTIREGLRRLAFEVRDAIGEHVAQSLHWSGPNTRRFISGSFRVRQSIASDGLFAAEIFPLGRSAALLARQSEVHTVRPDERADLTVGGKIAIPIPGIVNRGASGKVPASLLPARLLARDAKGHTKGFINAAGTALMYRRRSGPPVPAYALRSSTQQPRRLQIGEAAARAVHARAPIAFGRAIEKAAQAAGLKKKS